MTTTLFILPAARRLACFLGMSAALLAATGCEKAEIRDVAAQEKKWLGTWQVDEIRTFVTDTLGRELSNTVLKDQGNVEFRVAPGGQGLAYFKAVAFDGPCVQSALVRYFAAKNVGDGTLTHWELNWDADPDAGRVLIWGIGPLSSYRVVVTAASNDDKKRQFFYAIAPIYGLTNQQTLITWQLHR